MAGRPKPAEASGKGWIGNVMFAAVVVAGLVILGVQFIKPSDDEILSMQSTPEGAVKAYAKAAYHMKSGNQNFENMRKAVRKEDWEWFQDNYMNIYQDTLMDKVVGISSAAAPDQAAFVARLTTMQELAEYGPSREDVEIKSIDVSGDQASALVRTKENYGSGWVYYDVKVRLEKEGRYWKMVDYAGGRAALENRERPGDKVMVDPEVAEAEAAAANNAAPEGAPAEAPQLPTGQPGAFPGQPQPAGAFPGQEQPSFPGATQPQPGATQDQQAVQQQIQYADQLLAQASQFWRANRIQESLTSAQQALQIYQTHLGPQHPRVAQVQQMVTTAQQQLQANQQ